AESSQPGVDKQDRHETWWCFRLCRSRGKKSGRQLSLQGNERGGRDRSKRLVQVESRDGFRSDERTAGRAFTRCSFCARNDRIFSRRAQPGRASVYRQHLSILTSGLGSVSAARPNAKRGWLSADACGRDG